MTLRLTEIAIAGVEAMRRWSPRGRARLAAVLGWMLWWLAVPRRRVTLTNLRVCFPEWSSEQCKRVGRALFNNMARAVLDHGVLARAAEDEMRHFVRMEDGAGIFENPPDDRPLILLAPHFVGLNAGAVRMTLERKGVSIYARMRNAALDRWLLMIRQRFIAPELIAREGFDLRAAIRALQRGQPFYYLPDQDVGPRHTVFVPFFGVPAATMPMVSRMARMAGAQVVMAVTEMTDDGYVLHLEEPWTDFPGASVEEDTARMNRAIEEWVRKLPDQYLWTHKRFKTRPEGAAKIY